MKKGCAVNFTLVFGICLLKVSTKPGTASTFALKTGSSQADWRGGSTSFALSAAHFTCSGPVKYWMNSQAAFLFLAVLFIAMSQTHSFAPGCSPSLNAGRVVTARFFASGAVPLAVK